MPQWIFWEENISFVVFGAVYWPFSMVDYTERRKTERKKENVSPLHHRATTERRNIKRNKNETVFKFHWSMPQWIFWEDNISFVVLSCGLTFLYGRLHREKKDWEKKGKQYLGFTKFRRKEKKISYFYFYFCFNVSTI